MFTALAIAAHPGGPGFGFGLGWLFFILIPLFWIGLVVLVVSLARRRWARGARLGFYGPGQFGPGNFGHGPWGAARGAESTLAERFAQGDIDEKEYRARLEVLRASSGFGQRPE